MKVKSSNKIIISGAGIAGLATAIACRLHGFKIAVYEQASEISEVGAGLQVSANGFKVLQALGVIPHLQNSYFEPENIELRIGETGQQVFAIPMKGLSEKRWGAPYIHIHRADLMNGLLARLEELAPQCIHLNTRITHYKETETTVLAYDQQGNEINADLLIGADGIHSAVREQLLGNDNPRFTGNIAWRVTVPISRLTSPPPPNACVWVGDQKHAVTTRIKSGKVVNFVGIVEQSHWQEEGWKIKGSKEQALADFKHWDSTVTDIINASDEFYRWALFDRAALPTWHAQQVVLVGDAAHPMLPSMAQGAVQALEDAWILAQHLNKEPNTRQALRDYFATRYKRTKKIQTLSARNLRLFHKKPGIQRNLLLKPAQLIAAINPNLLHKRHDWVYGYTPNINKK